MPIDWDSMFDNFGVKRVSRTDKNKSAYVPNEGQRSALAAAGYSPGVGGSTNTVPIEVLFEPVPPLATSYYDSQRAGSGREPETRMGRGLIAWANEGDTLVIGNIGTKLYVAKANADEPPPSDLGRELSRKLDRRRIFKNARKASGPPPRRKRTINDFVRNPYVVAAAILRANGACEMPKCARGLFNRSDGSAYLEVHHVVPLGEGGDDTLVNAAALCPACHRELHFGARRMKRRAALAAHIATLPAR